MGLRYPERSIMDASSPHNPDHSLYQSVATAKNLSIIKKQIERVICSNNQSINSLSLSIADQMSNTRTVLAEAVSTMNAGLKRYPRELNNAYVEQHVMTELNGFSQNDEVNN